MIELIPPRDLYAAIEYERNTHNFRPTVAVLALESSSDQYLLVESKREESAGVFWPIQGGINPGEPITVGAAREAKEETGLEICPDRLISLGGFRYSGARPRDGYTAGKLLIGCFTKFNSANSGCKNIMPNPDEIESIHFASAEEILSEILPRNVELRPRTAPKAEFVTHLLGTIARLG